MVNSAGSLAMAEHRPREDAFIVRRLRDAGAVILGKTNLSEWANFRSTRSSSGWSSRGGQTKNPYALDRNPCGSSSGTGSAIAASLAIAGVGTETDGSILCPASVNGLVGMKPTVGLVSRSGIIPISVSQDTAGPMARTVSDVARLLTALAGVDSADPSGPAAEGHIIDYLAALKSDALEGRRFGVLRKAMGYHPAVDASMETAITALKAAGAEVVDAEIATDGRWGQAEQDVLLYEFKDGLNAYLKASGAPRGSLEELIAWNTANKEKAMPFFGQELFEMAQAKGPLTEPAYIKARDAARRLAGKDGLLATLEKNKLDAAVAPTVGPAWLTDHVLGDHFSGAGYPVAAVAGTPSLTVPIGDANGLPLGITFMGRPYTEADLLAWGFALEQATKARKAPEYKATLDEK
jgi:amidase